MKLKEPLPPDRTYEQIRNHYLVERAIAERLKQASREERTRIYATMYEELLRRVPDHPRLRTREERVTLALIRSKLGLVERFLDGSTVFVEFGPGDCRFAMEVAKRARFVYGVDISDQRHGGETPGNFELIIYDGYRLERIPDESADVAFSDQLIEHFHPEDARLHFALVHRILKKGGRYVLRTPHALSGPHDVSRYFADEPEGFHLKEWTYAELKGVLRAVGFTRFYPCYSTRGVSLRVPYVFVRACEALLSAVPRKYRKIPARYLTRSIGGVAVK